MLSRRKACWTPSWTPDSRVGFYTKRCGLWLCLQAVSFSFHITPLLTFIDGYIRNNLLCLSHPGKELYKRFLSVPGTNLTPSQGGDLDMAADPDVEIIHEDAKLPHLECLCLHLGDHTRDTEDVSPVSVFKTVHKFSYMFVYVYSFRLSALGMELLQSLPRLRSPTKRRGRSYSPRTRSRTLSLPACTTSPASSGKTTHERFCQAS